MSDEVEQIGYGRPPKKTQFKKGQSGNPKGRPRKSQTLREPVTMKVLNRKVSAVIDGRPRRISIGEAVALQVIEQASKGKIGALRDVMAWQREKEQAEFQAAKYGAAGLDAWYRTMSKMSDIAEVLMYLGCIYVRDEEIYFDRDFFEFAMRRHGIEDPRPPYCLKLSDEEVESHGPTWEDGKCLFDRYYELTQNEAADPAKKGKAPVP